VGDIISGLGLKPFW